MCDINTIKIDIDCIKSNHQKTSIDGQYTVNTGFVNLCRQRDLNFIAKCRFVPSIQRVKNCV